MDTPGELLKSWRGDRSPKQAAIEVGVERQTWWRWETGASKVARDKLDKVTKVTGIPQHHLRPDLAALFAGASQ